MSERITMNSVIVSEWTELVNELKGAPEGRPGSVYVVGACDSGKTTLCRFLVEHLSSDSPAGYIDCDPGQSIIGPPATIGLTLRAGTAGEEQHFRFVGGTTPAGHMLQVLVGVEKLFERAGELNAHWVILDSSGFVTGEAAREFQFQMIDLLQPDHIAAFRECTDLDRMLRNFKNHPKMKIHWLPPSPKRVTRSPQERREYRELRFREYFKASAGRQIPLSGIGLHGFIPDLRRPETYRNRLFAFCDRDNYVLCLGIVLDIDMEKRSLTCHCPPVLAERIASVQFGDIHLDASGRQVSLARKGA